MTHRERFLAVCAGKCVEPMPFFPDITTWYACARAKSDAQRKGGIGAFMSDSDPYHKQPGRMPEKYRDLTLLGFYKRFDWGFPVHHYDWYRKDYAPPVERVTEIVNDGVRNVKTIRLITPKGELVRREGQAADGSWCPVEHFCKEMRDLEIMKAVVESVRYAPRYDTVLTAMAEMGGQGIGDLPLDRSPFGKLVHEYMGFEQTVYALYEDRAYVEEFLRLEEAKSLELVRLAAQGPEPIVIMSDHADENLISPRQYEQYCIPYYQQVTKFLHERGKIVSTHLDGNFKGFFKLLGRTGFDLLDGCTPAPMFNYEVEELASAMPPGMSAYCGVPATLFCQRLPTERILAFGDRIARALRGRGILNIGDILPPDGDIEQAIALGRHITGRAGA
ncbi:MAG: uroporphyrinogen decarboxylase family protein [Phycisphaerae bacterium]